MHLTGGTLADEQADEVIEVVEGIGAAKRPGVEQMARIVWRVAESVAGWYVFRQGCNCKTPVRAYPRIVLFMHFANSIK